MNRRVGLLLGLVALASACATSSSNTAATPDEPDAGPRRALASPDGGYREVTAELPVPTREDLPGYPVDEVLPSIARQMLAFSQDAFSYDGCSTSLHDCLKQPAHQRHALRMLMLATRLAVTGMDNVQIDTALNGYYASFAGPRAQLTTIPAMCQGPAGAKVTLVEFSDFECPYCAAARPMLEGFITDAGLIQLCFKPFPLAQHPHASQAAETAFFAAANGHFWPMHDAMFAHQDALDTADLRRYAEDVELDPMGLTRALEIHVFADPVERSKAEGKRAGIKSTPSIFINGRAHDLPIDPDFLRHAIDDELEWQTQGGKWAPN